MKWSLGANNKLKNYKGEEFKGRVNKDFEIGDQYEEIDHEGKKNLLTVQSKTVKEDGSIIVVSSGGVVNG